MYTQKIIDVIAPASLLTVFVIFMTAVIASI